MHNLFFVSYSLQLVAFTIQGFPEDIFQFRQSTIGDSRDEDMREVIGKIVTKHLYEFIIQKVTLRDGKHTLFVEHIGIEGLNFVEQYLILLANVIGITWNHKQK